MSYRTKKCKTFVSAKFFSPTEEENHAARWKGSNVKAQSFSEKRERTRRTPYAAPQAGRTPHIGCTPCHTPHAGRTCTPRHMVARVARRESWRAALKASSTTVLRLYPRSKSVSHYVLQRWLALQIAGWLHRFLLQRGWKPTRLWHHHDDGLDAQWADV